LLSYPRAPRSFPHDALPISEGKPVVTDMNWYVPEDAGYRQVLYSLEAQSEHPLADAIAGHLRNEQVSGVSVSGYGSVTGMGVRGDRKSTRLNSSHVKTSYAA